VTVIDRSRDQPRARKIGRVIREKIRERVAYNLSDESRVNEGVQLRLWQSTYGCVLDVICHTVHIVHNQLTLIAVNTSVSSSTHTRIFTIAKIFTRTTV
jgi:hypothetical protein